MLEQRLVFEQWATATNEAYLTLYQAALHAHLELEGISSTLSPIPYIEAPSPMPSESSLSESSKVSLFSPVQQVRRLEKRIPMP